MIIQPERRGRSANDSYFESEGRRIDLLNQEFFGSIELTKDENSILVWLCGLDEYTINGIVSAFKKTR